MSKLISGILLGLVASASYAQDVVIFDVDYHTLYEASGAFRPILGVVFPGPFNNNEPIDPPNLTGQVTLSRVAGTNQLDASAPNTFTLNGSFSTESGASPSNSWSTHTFNNAVFDFGSAGGFVAVDSSAGIDWPLLAGTASDGLLSDHGPVAPCPFAGGCLSASSFALFEVDTVIFDVTANGGNGAPNFPTYADAGNHPLIAGTVSQSLLQAGIGGENGLDAIAFDFTLEGGQLPQLGGTVRFALFSNTANTVYMLEGTIASVVPVPAAVWLFGTGLGLLAWIQRRRATI